MTFPAKTLHDELGDNYGDLTWGELEDEATRLMHERDEWKARCRALTDPNPGGWTEALHEARAALDA